MSLVTSVDFFAKVVAAISSIAPLYLTIIALQAVPELSKRQRRLLDEKWVLAAIAFGAGYASCGDTRAVLVAGVAMYAVASM